MMEYKSLTKSNERTATESSHHSSAETISSPDAAMFGLQRSHSMLLAQHSPPPDAYGGQQPATAGNLFPIDGTRVMQGQQAAPFSPPQFSNDGMNLSPVDLISPPPPAASGDPGIGGRSTDDMEEWSGWRRRPVGLRALAGAREMGTLSQRRSRADIRARRRQSSVAGIPVMAQEAGDEALESIEDDFAVNIVSGVMSDQRKELLCCIFLFCCGLLACKYLIIEQYKISRRRQDAATTEHYKAQTPQQEVISPKLNQPPIVPFPMICVYSDTLLPSTPMPKDGLCDYTFFDSFYKDGNNKIDKGAVTSVSLATYLEVSMKSTYAKTQMGIAFSQYGASEAVRVINTDEGDDFMLELWKEKKLRHYGVLDVDARTANVNDILRLLQALRYQQQLSLAEIKSEPKPTAYIVVGVSFHLPRTGKIYAGLQMLFSQFPVDLLIARTHLDMRDDHREDCRITGPTVYREPYSIYQLSMVDVVKFLHEKRYSFSSFSVAISVTMRARWYSPRDKESHWYFDWSSFTYKYPYPGYEPGQPCTSLGNTEHFTSYFYVCTAEYHFTERLRQVSGDKQFMHTFSEITTRVLTFDNDVTIRGKYCDVREILNGVAYGIAIFDADQDAWHKNSCPYGPRNFDRMNMVRKLMDHISKPGRDHFPEGCWTVT